MARKRTEDRVRVLGTLFQLIAEVETEITAVEERERRMATTVGQSREDLARKFPAIQGGVR